MNMKLTILVVLLSIIALAISTEVQQCQGGKLVDPADVDLTNCKKGTCRLRRKTTVHVTLKFKPEEDVKTLITSVQATIAGLPVPFIGVDGTSACDNLYLADGETKTKCPLKSGESYVYKNQFPIFEIYPKLQTVVHWSLKSGSKDIVCFEVPAKITG